MIKVNGKSVSDDIMRSVRLAEVCAPARGVRLMDEPAGCFASVLEEMDHRSGHSSLDLQSYIDRLQLLDGLPELTEIRTVDLVKLVVQARLGPVAGLDLATKQYGIGSDEWTDAVADALWLTGLVKDMLSQIPEHGRGSDDDQGDENIPF